MRVFCAARSIVRTTLGIDRADRTTIAARLAVCYDCPHRLGGICRECGCVIKLKARDVNETCPLGEWTHA